MFHSVRVSQCIEKEIAKGVTQRLITLTNGLEEKQVEHLQMVSWEDDQAVSNS